MKERRTRSRLTQKQLAKRRQTTQAAISNWENGTYKIQHPKIVDDALKYLELMAATKD